MDQYYNDIEAYIQGELSGQNLSNFETALTSDAQLQEAVSEHRDMLQRLHGIRLRDTVKKNMVSPKPDTFSWRNFTLLLLLVAGAGVLIWYARQQHEPTLPAIIPPVVQPPVVPMANQQAPDTPAVSPKTPQGPKAPEDVITGDPKTRLAYNDAVQKLGAIDVTTMGEGVKDVAIEHQLNAAIRLLRANKPYQADPLVQQVLQKNNALYQEDAEWLNALGWLLRDPLKGKQLLEEIAQKPTHAYRRNAIRVLGQL